MTKDEFIKLDFDEQSRYKIINDIDKNIFVEASAGSGKTTQLVKRMVAMVESGIDVSKICTITFTKVAATEFYERFQSLLSIRMNPSDERESREPYDLPYTTEESRKKCANALENIDLCFMGTIDAFCNKIAKEHPLEIQIPSSSEVIGEDELSHEIIKFYKDTAKGKFGIKNQNKLDEYEKYFNDGIETFSSIMPAILDNRDKKFAFDNSIFDLKTTLEKDLKSLKELVEYIIDFGNRKSGNKGYITSDKKDKLSNVALNKDILDEDIEFNCEKVINLIDDLLSLNFNKSIVIDERHKDVFAFNGKNYIIKDPLPKKVRGVLNSFLHSKAIEFATSILDEMCRVFKENGIITYFDYLYYLRNVLKEDAKNGGKLAKHIYRNHSYFLLDESQDTNPMQTEIFFYITAFSSNEDWKKCNPRPGSIFIVGDPKQSIYRFRGADVQAFKDLSKLFEKNIGENLPMTRNFRSNNSLKRYYNDVMNDLLNTSVESCIHIDIPINPKDDTDRLDNTIFDGVYKYESKKIGRSSSNSDDAKNVTNIIKQLVNNPKYKIDIREEIDGKKIRHTREIKYSDFLIITKTTTAIPNYLEEFIKNNMPFESEGKTMFEKSSSLNNAISYLKCIANPTDKNALVELLSSNIYELTPSSISNIYFDGIQFNLFDNKICTNEKVSIALEEIKNIFNKTKNMSYSAMLEYIINNAKIFENSKLDYFDCLFYALEIIRKNEIDGNISNYDELISVLNDINSDIKDYERPMILSEKLDSIKIANVHKVKGAQAPIIILAQPDCNEYSDKIYIDRKENKAYIFYLNKKVYEYYYKTIIETENYRDKENESSECRIAENRRIEYVAATRAQCVLIISYWKDNDLICSPWRDLLNYEIETFPFEEIELKEVTKIKKNDLINDTTSITIDNVSLENKVKSYKVVLPSTLKIKKIKNEEEIDIQSKETNKDKKDSTTIGTIVHRLMECIISSNNKYDKDSIINEIINDYEVDKYKDLLSNVYDVVVNQGGYSQNGIKEDIVKEVLESQEYYCEVPFAYKDEDNIINGVIDLIYKKNDKWHIVDYKTNSEGNTEILKEEYKNQLDAYIKAFKAIAGEDADARIYHIEV